jgi:ketosteroid isomerase-like protein
MKAAHFCSAFALVALSLAPRLSLAATDREQVIGDIRAVIKAQEAAWNRGHIDGFMNGYARSNDTTFVSGPTTTRGWQTVRDRYKKKYDARDKMGTLTFSAVQVTPESADSAVVSGKWKLGRKNDTPHGTFKLWFHKTAQGWRIVRDETK